MRRPLTSATTFCAPVTSSLFADESGTSTGQPCYAIGVLTVADANLVAFNSRVANLVRAHGVVGEIRWAKVSTGHGLINCGLDLLNEILTTTLSFSAIVVKKDIYRKWLAGNQEEAFYTTYSMILKHAAQAAPGGYQVFIDYRSDSYDKRDEALGLITNRMLAKIASRASLTTVTKMDSKLEPGIQVADFITGAIRTGHHLFLDPACPLQRGKRVALNRLASMLGWDFLHHDTWPNERFNIWHFPDRGYRNVPGTREVVRSGKIPYVTAQDIVSA